LRGPFGGDLKKEIFVPKGDDTYKVYEQGVVLQRDSTIGKYYISKDYFENNMSRFEVKTNDFLISCSGVNYGAIYQLKGNIEKGVINQALLRVRLNNEIVDDNYFLYLFRIYIVNMIIGKKGDSTIPNFPPLNVIKNLKIHLPDLSNQKLIGKLFHSLDTKIELNNRINRELEAMAKTLYDYWFVQFDFPNEQGKPYKSSGGKMVYNAELKREIPEGWENGTLGDISDLVRGVTYDASDIKEENDYDVIPILRATNISGNVIDLDNMVFVPKQNVSANQVLNKFDILITMSSGSKDHIGKNGFFYFDKEVAFGAFCAKIVAKDKYRFYVYSYTQSDFMFSTIKNECLGTNINNLNGSLVKGFKIVIPPVDLVEKFNNEVLSIYEMIGNNHKQNQQLSELRDWLLPMLMNGQVMVKEAEDPDSYRENMAAEPSSNFGN
jgi:type I restriction enzyme S subunit